jgi:hypothetical protein
VLSATSITLAMLYKSFKGDETSTVVGTGRDLAVNTGGEGIRMRPIHSHTSMLPSSTHGTTHSLIVVITYANTQRRHGFHPPILKIIA